MGAAAGQILGSKYRLVERLGRGGMGEVWLAHQTDLDREVAVKLLATTADDEVARRRFEREARLAAKLRSPHVAQVFDYGQHEGHPYLVMERLVGEDLHVRSTRGPMPLSEVERVVDGVAAALTEAHEHGIVHRDIKPANVFFARAGDRETVKVLDFGIATRKSATGPLTGEGMVLGTPQFMSPEQSRGEAVDHRSDLWSLAVVAYVTLTGFDPFEATTDWETLAAIARRPIPPPSERVDDLPPSVDEFFQQALRRDPARRPQSAAELSERFARAVRGELVEPTADTLPMHPFHDEGAEAVEPSTGPVTDVVAVQASRPRQPRGRRLWPAVLGLGVVGASLALGYDGLRRPLVASEGLSDGAQAVVGAAVERLEGRAIRQIEAELPAAPQSTSTPEPSPPPPATPVAPIPAPADNEFGI